MWLCKRLPGAAVLLSAFGVLAPFALACGDGERPPPLSDDPTPSSIPGCEGFSYRPCDILSSACQQEVFGLMACARNEAPADRQLPPVLMMTEDDAIAAVSAAAEGLGAEEPSETFGAEVRGLEMLGLIEAGLLEQQSDVISVTVESVVAFYLIPTREIVIIDRQNPLDDLDANATLAHELVHAMQDGRHGLAQFTSSHSPSSDASLAAASVIEGEATFYQLLMMFAYEGVDFDSVDYRVTLDNLAELGRGMTLEAGSPMITATGIFPYTQGARYTGAHWLRGQGPAVDALYAEPPGTSLEVMAGGWTDTPLAILDFETPPQPLAGHSAVSDDVAGAWVVFGVLGALSPELESASSLEALAKRWRGDRLWVYQSDDDAGSVAALWAIAWDDPDAASSAAERLSAWAPEGISIEVSVEGSLTRIAAVENGTDLSGWVNALAAARPGE